VQRRALAALFVALAALMAAIATAAIVGAGHGPRGWLIAAAAAALALWLASLARAALRK
jgi:hypothetical protein